MKLLKALKIGLALLDASDNAVDLYTDLKTFVTEVKAEDSVKERIIKAVDLLDENADDITEDLSAFIPALCDATGLDEDTCTEFLNNIKVYLDAIDKAIEALSTASAKGATTDADTTED